LSEMRSYSGLMTRNGNAPRFGLMRGVLAMAGRRSPWGGGDKGGDNTGDDEGDGAERPPQAEGGSSEPPRGPRNPWLPPGGGEVPPRRSATIDDIFRARERRKGGGGGGGGPGGGMPRLPQRPDGKSWFPVIVGGIVLLWLGFSTVHMVGPKEQGIVTTFGKYSGTIDSGARLTLPWPIQSVEIRDVTSINRYNIPEGEGEKLMLTSDQNLVDLSYLVRWNIKNLKFYTFQLDNPEDTVREVAEAAMRASIAEVSLRDAMGGEGRALVEQNVRDRMQSVLDAYRSGVAIQGVEIKKADPPQKVIASFQQVTSAQQDAQRDLSNAQAWAQQLTARAEGDTALFNKVYEEFRLAPQVTKRRMYYETMERVLSGNDKIVVEAGVAPFLPLPELRRRATEAPTRPATSAAMPQQSPQGGQ
jgi:modulator of FtsH protease HflK